MSNQSNSNAVEEFAIGIDLGTTNSLVAILDPADPNGDVNVLTNNLGKRSTPSCVSFLEEFQDCWIVGEDAIEQRKIDSANTIFDAKRFIGSEYSTLVAKGIVSSYPFEVLDGGGNKPVFLMTCGVRKVIQRPQDIAAKILESLRKTVETALQDRTDKIVRISQAGITVPAYFGTAQKQATLEAAELAGISCVQLMSESVAAAFASSYNKNLYDGYKTLVFDFGGGTFDATILDVKSGKFVPRVIDGDMQLGGRDIDLTLSDYIAAEIKKIFGADKDCMADPLIRQKLLEKCESVKVVLTNSQFELFDVSEFFANMNTDKVHMFTISLGKFNELIRPVLMRTITIVQRVLKRENLTAKDIDEVLLVGGASRIPLIQSLLISEVGFSKAQLKISTDEAVVRGAALVAAQLVPESVDVSSISPESHSKQNVGLLSPNSQLVADKKANSTPSSVEGLSDGSDQDDADLSPPVVANKTKLLAKRKHEDKVASTSNNEPIAFAKSKVKFCPGCKEPFRLISGARFCVVCSFDVADFVEKLTGGED